MGQAKNRGSLEARIEAAIKSKDPRIDKLRADLGIPDSIRFKGYLLKVDDQDEFVADVSDGVYGFAASPEQALQFQTFDQARELARAEHGEVVVALFDFGSKLVVAHVSDDSKTSASA